MLIHSFNDLEGLKIAVEMERRGEAFYRASAKITKNAATKEIFLQLAQDEAQHKSEFEKLTVNIKASQEFYDSETNAYLSAIASDIVFPEGLMSLKKKGFDTPEGALIEAIQSEKDSVLFYTELSSKAYDADARRIFDEIIRQERSHMRILQTRLSALVEGA